MPMASEPAKHCKGMVSDGWNGYRCGRVAKDTVVGIPLCGIHKRVAKKWEEEGRLISMMEFWWHIKVVV